MVWGEISSNGKNELAVIRNTINADRYTEILKEFIHPFSHAENGTDCSDFIYVQDNTAVHIECHVRTWSESINIEGLVWPARSPDLNLIENIWGMLDRAVYMGDRQFYTEYELKYGLLQKWNEISVNIVVNLVQSMPKKCIAATQANGWKIKY